MPHKGLGYGVLRYLGDTAGREQMAALPQARITFNYLASSTSNLTVRRCSSHWSTGRSGA